MPKFQHKGTRSIVDVDEETAATLGREWAPFGLTKADGGSSQSQQRELSRLLEAAGFTERAAKFATLGERLGRPVKAFKDITDDEADELIKQLNPEQE